MVFVGSLAVELDALLDFFYQFEGVLHLHHIQLMDAFDPSHKPLYCVLLDEGEGYSSVIVSAGAAHPMQVDVEVDVGILF